MSTRSAVVVGASMAGLLAARILSEHVDHVEIVERDHLGDLDEVDDGTVAVPRRGVPQGRHAHALLAAGQLRVGSWFPGIIDELERAGAVRARVGMAWWHQGGAYRVRSDVGDEAVMSSRPLLEATVRRRLLRDHPVVVTEGATVDDLLVAGGAITGVVVDGREQPADLVVDCSGRHTRCLPMLARAGLDVPTESHITIDMAYGTRVLRRRAGDLDGPAAILVGDPQGVHRIGVPLPMEGERWILTLAGFHGDAPPVDDDGYLAFARSLPSPLVADLLERTEALSPVMTHRMPSSQRRHFERLRRPPNGFLALGDAICSFNPIYGQGMSSAAMQADALDQSLTRHGPQVGGSAATLPRDFYRRAARVVATPWKIAAGADFANSATTGAKPSGTDLVNRYIAKVLLACHTSADVNGEMTRVQNLISPPESLLRPAMVARVLRAARRSPVVTGSPQAGPVVGAALRPVA